MPPINDNLEAQATAIFRKLISKSEMQSSIYDILSISNGLAYSSEYFNTLNQGFPLVRIRDLKTCIPEVWTNEQLKTAEYVQAGDILIGMDGEFVPYIWYGDLSLLNQRVCKAVPKSNVHPFFVYATLKPILSEAERTQGGTTVIHLGKKDFDKMYCMNVDCESHTVFSQLVDPYFSAIISNYKEILSLNKVGEMLLCQSSR